LADHSIDHAEFHPHGISTEHAACHSKSLKAEFSHFIAVKICKTSIPGIQLTLGTSAP
jgi:hypothetical protein